MSPLCVRHGVSILSYSSLALGLLTGKIGPERKFEGDDLRIHDPRFSVANRRKVADFAAEIEPIAGGTWRHRRRAGHRLDDTPAGHHLRALRGAESGAGEGERARRLDPTSAQADLAGINAAATRHLAGIHA